MDLTFCPDRAAALFLQSEFGMAGAGPLTSFDLQVENCQLALSGSEQLGGPPMGLTLKVDVLAVVAAFGFLAAIVFGAF
jgi:hypothetical protein